VSVKSRSRALFSCPASRLRQCRGEKVSVDEQGNAAPDSPASTPAPSAPSVPAEAPRTDEKPARVSSWRDALTKASQDPDASPGSPSVSADSSPAAATVLPTDADATPPADGRWIPHSRFNEELGKKKAAEAQVKDLQTQLEALAWAKDVDRAQIAESLRWHHQAFTDPGRFLDEVIRTAPPEVQELAAQRLRSEYGRRLAQPDPRPKPDLVMESGQGLYSADGIEQYTDYRLRQQQAEWVKQLKPLQDQLQAVQKEREQIQQAQAAHAFARQTMDKVAAWPRFHEFKDEIAKVYAAQPMGGGTQNEEMLALYEAYLTVLQEKVFPSIDEQAEATVEANFRKKAVASSEQPGRATTTTPTKPKSMGESIRAAFAAAGVKP